MDEAEGFYYLDDTSFVESLNNNFVYEISLYHYFRSGNSSIIELTQSNLIYLDKFIGTKKSVYKNGVVKSFELISAPISFITQHNLNKINIWPLKQTSTENKTLSVKSKNRSSKKPK